MKDDNEEKYLGDNIEEILEKIGADKLARAFEETTGHDCGCEGRKKLLNAIHKWWNNLFRLNK